MSLAPDAVVARVSRIADELLGRDCLSVCLYGSATAGGLRPESDVDLLLVTERSLDDRERGILTEDLLGFSGRRAREGPGRPVELTAVVRADVVPWRYPPRRDYQYGEWLREDYERGLVPTPTTDPDLAVLITQVRQSARVVRGAAPQDLLDPVPPADLRRACRDSVSSLVAELAGDERNVVLTLARMWVTVRSGEIVSKDEAAARVGAETRGHVRTVVARAGAAYRGEIADDWAGWGPALRDYVAAAIAIIEERDAADVRRDS